MHMLLKVPAAPAALSIPVLLASGAAVFAAAPAAAQDACLDLGGGVIECSAPLPPPGGSPPGTPPTNGSIDVTGSADPLDVTLEDGFVSNGPFNLGTLAGADIDIVSEGVSTVEGTTSGVTADSGRNLTARISNISTAGDGATGAALSAADDLVFVSDGLVSTAGASAPAIVASGESVTLDLDEVRTSGPDAAGVETFSAGGPTSVTFNLVETGGDGSPGVKIEGSGDNNLQGNAIRTQGTDAAAFEISNDAAACVILGAGGCDNTVAVDEVTTDGFGSTGGLISSAGNSDVSIGVLRTEGDQAAGLDISNDPTACVALGVGQCDTAFTVDELETNGNDAPGAIVAGAGDIDASVDTLATRGDDSDGLVLSSDPSACAVLGAGGCDTSFSLGRLTAEGDGATGVLVRAAGDTSGSVGSVETAGAQSPGIDIATDPTACVIAGAGQCDVGLAADEVATQGDDSAAVLIDNAGLTTADLGALTTGGDNAPGLAITQDPTACAALGPGSCGASASADETRTQGDDSPGIDMATPGPVDLDAGAVETLGEASDAIRVAGGEGDVDVVAENVTTAGADSDGIDVSSTTGAQTIAAGSVEAAGQNADAIVAAAVCADIDISVSERAVSADGSAIVADSGCGVGIATAPGSTVSGRTAGIDASSGTGATIAVGGSLTASEGPALDVDGASATVTIGEQGSIAGRIDLTDSDDSLVNEGLLAPVGDSDFGLGADVLLNRSTVAVDGAASLGGLEEFANEGLIDLADGAAGDELTLGGDFSGGAGSRIALDVDAGTAGTPADRLVVGGDVSGATTIDLALLGGPAVVNADGALLVDAAGGDGGFTLAGPTRSGLIDYRLEQSGGEVRLLALPNELAVQPLLAGALGQQFWYQSADAWSASAEARRALPFAGDGRIWLQGYGGEQDRGDARGFDVFSAAVESDLRYETSRYGVQAGADFGRGATRYGITGGWGRADSEIAEATEADLDGFNIGAYLLHRPATDGVYGELLAKADFFDGEFENGTLFTGSTLDGTSYGAEGELGYRWLGGVTVDVGAGLAYVRTDIEDFSVPNGDYEFEAAESLRGRLGIRIAGRQGAIIPFGDIKLLHEFMGENEARFVSGGFTLPLAHESSGTWVRGEAGLVATRFGGFLAAWLEAGDVEGFGLRAGLRF
ncbi:MAG: autotransporter outer membrane beta-barrel domain-containing protein [Sphingomonadaceae bacterium]